MNMFIDKAELRYPNIFKKPTGIFGKDWHVFDDHVCIDDNVTEYEDNFTLKVSPVGTVSILFIN